MVRSIILYGLLSGAIMVSLFLGTFLSGLDDQVSYRTAELIGYISMIISLLMIMVATLKYRKQHHGISFKQAFGLGVGISVVAGVIFGIFTVVLYTVISPELSDELMVKYLQQLENSGLSAAEMEQAKQQIESINDGPFGHPIIQGAIMGITVWLVGLVMSTINAMVFSFGAKR